MELPERIETEEALDALLSTPTQGVLDTLSAFDGDLLILGIGGKMGPTLGRMAVRAQREAGSNRRVIGVSRFSAPAVRKRLEGWGIETLAGDLLDGTFIEQLPDTENVLFMAGRKFGSTGSEWLTWAMNTYLPGRVAEHFRESRIVAFSTGNVYPLVPIDSGGATETTQPEPIGEYAQSCLGRERMFEHASARYGTPSCLLRLNYAIDLRYGVLLDLAEKVYRKMPIDLSMGYVNVIWQGDANAVALQAFTLCGSPPTVLNVTGPKTLSTRTLATEFGDRLGRRPILEGEESATALLNNASHCHAEFGLPSVPITKMLDWTASWIRQGSATLGKPTHYDQRDGRF